MATRAPAKISEMPTRSDTAKPVISSSTEFNSPPALSTRAPSTISPLPTAPVRAFGAEERSRRTIDQSEPKITTRAPTEEATAATTRGPAPNTSLPCGRTSEAKPGSIGAATTTPAATAQATTVSWAIRSARRRSTSR